ncbi:unnamed protein product, partial [Choristocarpus tenellus]
HGQGHKPTEDELIEKSARARSARRRSSLLQMGVANAGIKDVAKEVLMQEVAAEVTAENPIQKLQQLLTKAKERGMSAEELFEHFAPVGKARTSITPAMFETALQKLGKEAFQFNSLELEHVVNTFDSDENGTIEMCEFMEFCLSIPSLPWKAERARR